jgi:general secretion pathway protein F/type IV pilus assembly protein PilC
MPEFAYTARNHAGGDVAGTISATNRREALCALCDRQLFPLTVKDAVPPRPAWQRKRRVKTALLATTLTQLADLLQSGVPLLRSLDVLAEQAVSAVAVSSAAAVVGKLAMSLRLLAEDLVLA